MKVVIKRPVILTIICIVGLLWSLLNFIFVFSPFIKKISDWAPAIYGIIVAFQFIAFIGVWHMKRWGVLFYFLYFFLTQIFSILINDIGLWEKVGIVLSSIFIIFFLIFYRKMDEEL
jgi:hypothetical protein